MIDPWTKLSSEINECTEVNGDALPPITEFEDNFVASQLDTFDETLPDSKQYLQNLERKLANLKRNADIIAELTAKREVCMDRLLRGSIDLPTFEDFDDESLDSTKTREILRHIIPQQPLNPSELISIIKYDQFEALNGENTDQADRENSR